MKWTPRAVVALLIVAGVPALVAVGLIRACSSNPADAVTINDHANVKDDIWCMGSKEALGKLIELSAKNAHDEMNELFVSEGVTNLRKGQSVRVIDESFNGFKVQTWGGQTCWITSNMLTKGDNSGLHGNATSAVQSTEQQPSDDHFYTPATGGLHRRIEAFRLCSIKVMTNTTRTLICRLAERL